MEYVKIRNWSRWQSFRADRGQPPWIKLHRRLLRNPEWVSLTDAQRGQLVVIWLLAADHDGAIPASPDLIKRLCQMSADRLDLQVFVEAGFLEPWQPHDAKVTPERRQDDRLEKSRDREETDTETDLVRSATPINCSARFDEFWSAYPKHVGKKQCRAKWKARRLDERADTLIADIGRRLEGDREWRAGYIPNPLTYLNGDRWEDEILEERPRFGEMSDR